MTLGVATFDERLYFSWKAIVKVMNDIHLQNLNCSFPKTKDLFPHSETVRSYITVRSAYCDVNPHICDMQYECCI